MAHTNSKKASSVPDPKRISTRSRNAAVHPGQIVLDECSNRRPAAVIQAEKEKKAARHAKIQEKKVQYEKSVDAVAEYEQEMAAKDAIEAAQHSRRRAPIAKQAN